MEAPELGKVARHHVPPGLAVDLSQWARGALLFETGYLLRIAWTDASKGSGPVAHLVGADLVRGFRPLSPPRRAVAASQAERVCELLTALLEPVALLLARGVTRDELGPARRLRPDDVLSAIWRLEQTPQRGMGNARGRNVEAKALERAAAIVEKWRATIEVHTPRVRVELADNRGVVRHLYPSGKQLQWLATNLRTMSAKEGTPEARRVLVCARVLEALLKRAGTEPVAREIAAVVKAAWPADYRPDDSMEDEGSAARKLLARARKRVTAELLGRALAALPSSAARRLAALPPSAKTGRRNVPANVPAPVLHRPHSTPPQPRAKKKTPR